ncbi:LuxR family transcriptional regulator, partial [uncultured Cetobacterium sp.]
MIKILICLVSLFLYTITFTQEAYIASFNTLRLGKNRKDYIYLAKAIQPFDLIGLVEVMNKKGIEKLTQNLNNISNDKWDYILSPYPVGTDNYKEYYGYIFKKDKVKHIKNIGYYPDYGNKFIREPFGANFKINNFDFTFVLAHSIYGKKISQRQFEANEMVNVYNYFQNKDPKENDILIGGDFNLPGNNTGFSKLL